MEEQLKEIALLFYYSFIHIFYKSIIANQQKNKQANFKKTDILINFFWFGLKILIIAIILFKIKKVLEKIIYVWVI